MSVIESTTGHSRTKEKSVARILYACIVAAVIIGIAIALLAGRNSDNLNPQSSDSTQQVAPDLGAPPAAAPPASAPPANQ